MLLNEINLDYIHKPNIDSPIKIIGYNAYNQKMKSNNYNDCNRYGECDCDDCRSRNCDCDCAACNRYGECDCSDCRVRNCDCACACNRYGECDC